MKQSGGIGHRDLELFSIQSAPFFMCQMTYPSRGAVKDAEMACKCLRAITATTITILILKSQLVIGASSDEECNHYPHYPAC